MTERLSVVIVHLDHEDVAGLEAGLASQPVEILHARSCRDAAKILAAADPPHLVFTDATLPDGSWADVIGSARKAPVPVNVIVVARLVDTRFYVEVIEAGAYDFIAPPFRPAEFDYVVHCAAENVLERREACARAERTAQRQLFPALLQSEAHDPSTRRFQPVRPAIKIA